MNNSFTRDPVTNAVVNTNIDEIRAAKERKAKKLAEKQKYETLAQEISSVKDDMAEIKNLLKQVINGNTNV